MRFNLIKSLLNNGNIVIVVFLISFHSSVYCQDNKSIDSLEQIYVTGNYAEKDQLGILYILSQYHQNTEKRLAFCEELIKNAKSLDSVSYLFKGYLEKANTYRSSHN